MADVEKRSSDVAHDVVDKTSLREADVSEQENAVGYKEYREAMNLEVSDKEVGFRPGPLKQYSDLSSLSDAQSPLEA